MNTPRNYQQIHPAFVPSPDSAGCFTSEAAAAFGAEPMPAFVGEQATLDAHHHCHRNHRTKETTCCRIKLECFGEDQFKISGNIDKLVIAMHKATMI